MLGKELSENKSELIVKDKELLTLKEGNKLLAKQFRKKKEKRAIFTGFTSYAK